MEELLYELEDIRSQKSYAIRTQKYGQAAMLVDQERQLYRNIHIYLNGDGDKWTSDAVENSIISYLENKHNIEINIENFKKYKFKELIRQIKLSKLGL